MPRKAKVVQIADDAVVCGHCHWFKEDPDEQPHGFCLVNPPTPMLDEDGLFSADPPVSFERIGCHRFKRKCHA